MSPLWSNELKKSINNKKPSPINQIAFSDSARNPESSLEGYKKMPPVILRFIKGTSLFAFLSKKVVAGMAVEASLVLPLFLFFFLNLGCAIELIRVHGNLQLALWQIGSKVAVYGYAIDSGADPESVEEEGGWWKDLGGIALSSTLVRQQMIRSAGSDYLDQSPLTNGAGGLQFWESELFGDEDKVDVIVTYSVSPWSSLMGFRSFRMANRYYAHIWNGYGMSISGDAEEGGEESKTVYVTETGTVYHLSMECTHLKLSVSSVAASVVDEQRNQNGGKYHPCARCAKGSTPGTLYITGEGDRYHYDAGCSGLKRTVSSMLKEQAEEEGYRACSRCGG